MTTADRGGQPSQLHRVGLSALAQPRLTKGGQPYLNYIPCQLANSSTGQLIVSPCPHAHVPPRGYAARHKKTRHSRDGSLGSGYPVPEGKAD